MLQFQIDGDLLAGLSTQTSDLEDALDRHAVDVTESERAALVAYLETR
jgi:hypothetical protein